MERIMIDPRKEPLDLRVSEAQAGYLQRLGLNTLLEKKFSPKLKRFWSELIKNKLAQAFLLCFVVVCGCLFSIVYTMQKTISETNLQAGTNQMEMANAVRRAEVLAEENKAMMEFIEFKALTPEQKVAKLIPAIATFTDFNTQGDKGGNAILHHMCHNNCDPELIDWAVDHGAELNLQKMSMVGGVPTGNLNGMTPLMIAIRMEHWDLAFHIVNQYSDKIDWKLKNGIGKTTGDIAIIMAMKTDNLPEAEELVDLINSKIMASE